MSTRFYAGQQDYIIQLNLLDDSFNNVYGTITGKANSNNGVFTGTTTIPYLFLNRLASASVGVQWYDATKNDWTEYLASGGTTSQGPKGNLTAPSGTLVTGMALRSFANNTAGNGWTWEVGANTSTTPAIVAEMDVSGNAKFSGTVTAPNFAGQAAAATTATVADDTATNATMYVTWSAGTSGNQSVKTSSTKLTFNPSTGALTAPSFVGALTGTATNATNVGVTDDNANGATVYPMWVTTNSGNTPGKVSSTNFQFVPSSGSVTLTGSGSAQLTLNRTGSAINTTVAFTNTSGTVYVGHGATNTFAVGGANDLTSAPWFKVNSTDGTFSGNLTVTGNLVINGSTTTVNSTTMTVTDPLITLGGSSAPTSNDGKDRGIEFRWYGTSAKTGFFGYKNSTGRLTFIPDGTNTSEVYSGAVGTIEANLLGNVTGNVTGNTSGTAANVTGIVAVVNGGTGASTAATARSNLGAAASGPNSDITTLSGLTTAFTIPAGSTAAGLLGSANNAVAAAGSTQGTATALTNDFNVVTSGTGGVVLQNAASGKTVVVVNRTGSAINVYPATGHSLDALAVNTAISLLAGGWLEVNGSSTTAWQTSYQALTQGSLVVGNIPGNAVNVTGTVAAGNGGTGITSYTVGDMLYASGAAALSKLAAVATGNVLISGGASTAPSWGKVGLTTHVSGTLPVANGGTGVTTSTGSGNVVLSASPTFTGTVTIPTPPNNDSGNTAASTAFVKNQGYATLASPTFTGTVIVPTATTGDSSTAAASTAFTQQAAADAAIVYAIVFG